MSDTTRTVLDTVQEAIHSEPRVAPHAAWRILLLFLGVLLPLFGFGVLADNVLEQELFAFDAPIQLFMHGQANGVFDAITVWSSRAGSAWGLVPLNTLVAVWLYRRGALRQTWFWLLATAGAATLNLVAKYSFARPRPSLWVSISPETGYSFPSGHSMAIMALAAAVVCLVWHERRWRPIALAAGSMLVLLIGSSRIYLGVHYPSDVLAGWLASLAWVVGLAVLMRPRKYADAV
jgi:membrane-associated phospholipid phosphatase